MAGALDGVRVVDLTTVVMGPLATRMLGDHGADVIRIEHPDPTYDIRERSVVSSIALGTNRNKRNVQLDLKTAEGIDACLDIVDSADVFVSNVRSDALDRLGLGAGELRRRRPELIHCVTNGYGNGPYRGRAAYDDAIQAASGLASLGSRVHGDPQYVPSIIADKTCALYIVQAVMAALLHRSTSGEGQTIEVPMFETMVAFNLVEHLRGASYEPPIGTMGYDRVTSPNRRPYRCRDGWIALLPYSTDNYRAFFAVIGRPDLIEDPRFATHRARIVNAHELYGLIADAAGQRSLAEWMAICDEHSIPWSPVVELDELPTDTHVEAVGLIEAVDHPTIGRYVSVNDPVVYDTLDTSLRLHAGFPGEHTAEVMAELGWSAERIRALEPRHQRP